MFSPRRWRRRERGVGLAAKTREGISMRELQVVEQNVVCDLGEKDAALI
jgi:hypothetical protein